MKKLNKKGFTIIELVIVIAVIAILAGVMIPTFSSIVTKAKLSAAEQEAKAYYKEIYAIDWSDGLLDGNDKEKTIVYKKDSDQKETAQIEQINKEAVTIEIYYDYDADGTDPIFKYVKDGITVTYAKKDNALKWESEKE